MMLKRLLTCVCLCAIASVASAQGLEVYLPFDGDVNDYSGNGNNGVLFDGDAGTNAYDAGMRSYGLNLGLTADENKENAEETKTDGDYVAIDYKLPEEGTVALWYKKSAFDYNYESVWDNSGTSPNHWDNWECWIDDWGPGDLYARAPDGADNRWNDEENRAVQYPLTQRKDGYQGEWLHIGVTWKKLDAESMEMNLFLDGELVDTAPSMVWQEPGDTFYVGGGNDDNTYGIGTFDELGIWNRQLSGDEIHDVSVNGVPEPGAFGLLLMGLATLLIGFVVRKKRARA